MPQIKSPDYHFPDRSGPQELGTPFRRIVIAQLISPDLPNEEVEDRYLEAKRLVETLEGQVVGRMVQRRKTPHAEYAFGPGKADEMGRLCGETEADTIVFDGKLSPNQISNLEHETASHLMDRTELILEIFARRATTAEAKMQVELAYLDYVHPKMNKGTQLRAQRGGLRGFGDSPLTKKIRAARSRADVLRKKIEKLQKQAETRIKRRDDRWTVALVGYTNAGKSSLLNALAGDQLYADDRLFATLDTTTRRVHLAERKFALISDTVGFIRRLPHELVASFHSTLSEALAARLLLHVADASAETLPQQIEAVDETLHEIDGEDHTIQMVFNKIDVADPETLDHLRKKYPDAVFVSAVEKTGLVELKNLLLDRLDGNPPSAHLEASQGWDSGEKEVD